MMVVCVQVRILEEDPAFDAGVGSVLTRDGQVGSGSSSTIAQVEMDAMVMEGSGLGVGAVAAVSTVRSPVLLARSVRGEVVESGRMDEKVKDGCRCALTWCTAGGCWSAHRTPWWSAGEQRSWGGRSHHYRLVVVVVV